MKELKNKSLSGFSWSFIDKISNSGITFLLGIILARLIEPAEFGLLGMITVFVTLASVFIEAGFFTALVRKQNSTNVDYNTVFYSNLFFGILIYILFYLFSKNISSFFNEPRLVLIARVVGLVLIINAFSLIQRALLSKKIDFKTQAKISFLSSVFGGVIGIILAYLGYGVWSLIWQTLIKQFIQSLLLWLFGDWRPSFIFSFVCFKELFSFSYKVLLSVLLDRLYKNIYYVVIGKFYSASLLGNYTRAEQFNSIFSTNLTVIVQKVSFPVFSSIQDDNKRLKIAFRKVLKSMMLIAFVCMLCLAAIAKPLIFILIGPKWEFCVGYLQIICFSGMLFPLNAINMNILDVKGRSDLFLKIEVLTKFISIPHIVIGILWGIEYMLWGGVLTTLVIFFFKSYYTGTFLGYSSLNQLKDILPSFLVAMLVSSFIFCFTFLDISFEIMLLLQIFIGAITTFGLLELFKLSEYLELKKIVLNKIYHN